MLDTPALTISSSTALPQTPDGAKAQVSDSSERTKFIEAAFAAMKETIEGNETSSFRVEEVVLTARVPDRKSVV